MGSARTSAALRKLCMFNRRSVPRIIVAPCHSHSFFPFSLAYHNIFHCWVNDLSRIHMLICVRPQNKCPFSQELQSEGNKKSLYKQISNHLKKHLSHSSGHLCLFSAVRFCARYVNCLWKSHRSSYEAGHAKRNKKKKACIRWHVDISTWEISSKKARVGQGSQTQTDYGNVDYKN